MKKIFYLLTLSALFLVGCSSEELQTTDSSNAGINPEASRGGVIHHVSLGGNDYCEAVGLPNGCDKSFSLVANMMADGTVKGQWQDKFAGDDGIHVSIDCLIVNGNEAVVRGIVTKGTNGDVDLTGWYAYTAVVDNGTSQNDDDDLMSFSYFFENSIGTCNDYVEWPFQLLQVGKGQVTVW